MAVSPLQLTGFGNVNNLVDQSQWNTLGNLRNVYQQQEDRQTKLAALGALGTDPQANMQAMLTSRDPALAQIGLNMQQKQLEAEREAARYKITDARADTLLGIQVAAARRAAADAAQADADRAAAPGLVARALGGGAPAATPFPAPLPTPGAPPQGLPPQAGPIAPAAPIAPPQAAPVAPVAPPVNPAQITAPPFAAPANPNAFEATPRLPASFQPVPVKAADEEADPTRPSWLSDPVANRVAENLTSPHPPAAAGVSREQLGQLYANPITKPLATVFLQNMMNPGTWKVEKTEDGRVIAYNDKTLQSKDITPGGDAGMGKQEREVQGYFKAGKALGMNDDQAAAFAANKGKVPSEDLKPGQQKRVDALTDNARVSERVLQNVRELRTASKDAWGFTGAGPASLLAATVLPNSLANASGAVATQDLINAAHSNVANVAKATFGSRVSNLDVNLLKDLESSANQPDIVRQKIYDRAEKVFSKIQQEDAAEAEGIRNKTWYKPGGGDRPAAPASGAVDFRTYFGK